jgi:hypothetical protein
MAEETKAQEAQQPETTTEAQAQQASTDLNISDLNALRSIIDVATQRGAFKAGEMAAIGTVYNKLSAFLDNVTKKEGQ